MARTWAVALVVTATLVVVVLAFAPLVRVSSCETTDASPAGTTCASSTENLVEREGAGVLPILAVPVVLAVLAAALPSRRGRFAVAGALTFLVLLGAASIGVFLLPVAALAWVLASKTERRPGAA